MKTFRLALLGALTFTAGTAHATIFEISFFGDALPGYTLPLDHSVDYFDKGLSLNFFIDDGTSGATSTTKSVQNEVGVPEDPSFTTTSTLSGTEANNPIKAVTLSGGGQSYYVGGITTGYISKTNFNFVACPAGSSSFCENNGSPLPDYALGEISVSANTRNGGLGVSGGIFGQSFNSDDISGNEAAGIYEGYSPVQLNLPKDGIEAEVIFGSVKVAEVSAIPSAVPEPASWAMMIFGVGFAGGALRRQRHATTTKVSFA